MTDPDMCPWNRKEDKNCYACGLGVRRILRKYCPYLALANRLAQAGAALGVERGRINDVLSAQWEEGHR